MRPDGQTAAEEEGNFGLAKRSGRPLEALLDLVERLVAACHGSRIPFLGFGQSRGHAHQGRCGRRHPLLGGGAGPAPAGVRGGRPSGGHHPAQATSPPTASPSRSRSRRRHAGRRDTDLRRPRQPRLARGSPRGARGGAARRRDPAARTDRGDMHSQRRRGRNRRDQGLRRRVLGLAATRFR